MGGRQSTWIENPNLPVGSQNYWKGCHTISTLKTIWVLNYANDQLKEQNNKVITIEENFWISRVFETFSAGTVLIYHNDGLWDTVFYDKPLPHDFASWVFGDSMDYKHMNGGRSHQRNRFWLRWCHLFSWLGWSNSYIKSLYKEKDGLRLVSINNKYKDIRTIWRRSNRIWEFSVGNHMPIEN